jgi:ankyrin repeat protein
MRPICHHSILLAAILISLLSISSVAQQNESALIEAASQQDWQALSEVLNEDDIEVNATQPDGATALAWAVHWDNQDAVRRLLASGADSDIGNDYGVTPLFLAIKNQNADTVNILLEGGADPDSTLWSGETPLMTASKAGSPEVVNLLIEYGANVNAREPRRGQSALMWAISYGHSAVAQLLIRHGADVNAQTRMLDEDFSPMVLEGYVENVTVTPRGGYTPLMFAARSGDLDTARLLLERGAQVNGIHADFGPPLVIAAAAGYEDMAIFLLEQGANPNSTDSNGMTALHYAMRDGLKKIHDLKITNKTVEQDKNSLLPGRNMHKLIEVLLTRGADPNAAMKYPSPILRVRPSRGPRFNMDGATPMLLAAASQDVTAMEKLLQHGADPFKGTVIDKESFQIEIREHSSENQVIGNATPLMVAVGMGRRNRDDFTQAQEQQALKAARMLVDLGADINAVTATGWTPLHAAAFIGADTLVSYLVEKGARVNIKNGCGQTPLSLALRASTVGLTDNPEASDTQESTVELLLSLGADDTVASGPLGECVLGRAGLQVNLELHKRLQELRER